MKRIINKISDPKRAVRVAFLVMVDAFLINFSYLAALYTRGEFMPVSIFQTEFFLHYLEYAPINTVSTLLIFYLFQLYSSLWEYAGLVETIRIVLASFVSSAVQLLGMYMLQMGMPRSIVIIYPIFLTFFVGGVRFAYRWLRFALRDRSNQQIRTMLIGAGDAGNTVLRELQESAMSKNKVVCVIDDDPAKRNYLMRGVPIVGSREDILHTVKERRIEEIIFAIPTASSRDRKEIIHLCQQTGCKLKVLPGIFQLANGEVSVRRLREVEVEDLLGRDPILVDQTGIGEHIAGKVVLVTGGGGSIGSELCRQIATYHPKQLIVFDIYENNAYDIQQELISTHPELDLVVLIGSVRDRIRLTEVFETYRPHLVYHAAAHKHVPLMEFSPAEAVKNNVFGTKNTAEIAHRFGVERFVLISSDKAVNPTNVMGATKRICEMVVQMIDRYSKTEFVAVRFGNVLGSNGSVIPLFKKQIAMGGPVTVTDPNVIRYFMTIPEAVSLVLQAGVYAKGGEIFILDMGDPVKIDDLARNLIRLSGYVPDVDIPIVYTGLRPGEKLYEELLLAGEGNRKTENDLIFIGKDQPFDDNSLTASLQILEQETFTDPGNIRTLLAKMVPEYSPK